MTKIGSNEAKIHDNVTRPASHSKSTKRSTRGTILHSQCWYIPQLFSPESGEHRLSRLRWQLVLFADDKQTAPAAGLSAPPW